MTSSRYSGPGASQHPSKTVRTLNTLIVEIPILIAFAPFIIPFILLLLLEDNDRDRKTV